MSKIKALTPRGTRQAPAHTIADLNRWYAGRANYYSLTQYPSRLSKIEAHIRRRLRARLMSQQKRKQHLYRHLVKRGVPRKQAAQPVFSNQKQRALSATRAVTIAYPNSWFINLIGQEIRSDRT
ncbi:group II intron maturase-specific domain-containing protein [Methylomonas sp. MgM2]